jgi:hypothetical protein
MASAARRFRVMTTRIIMSFEDFPIIHSYSRAQAIADGVLVDLSDSKEAKEAGFRFPIACTSAVWAQCIEWTADDTARQVPQDQTGRLWDVLYMLQMAIRTRPMGFDGQTLLYRLYVVPRGGKARRARQVVLKVVLGPGDRGEPVFTIMLPTED